jgi:eukaryotic-like serine/threonine-protein kinase
MSLSIGSRPGPYEVLAPLGAGGTDEVYGAHGTRLGRDIAIKVLPQSVASDPERLARFEREAKVLASLNHPAIATIHGGEEPRGMNVRRGIGQDPHNCIIEVFVVTPENGRSASH